MNYSKIGTNWSEIIAAYKKDSGEWVILAEQQLLDYLNSGAVFIYGHHEESLVVHTLVINGPSYAVGSAATYVAVYDGRLVSASTVWAISEGSAYASIAQDGTLSILAGASASPVTLSASYNGLTVTKAVSVTYDAGAETESQTTTETETNESGQTITTTTTTTTTTDGEGNTTTTQVVTQVIENEDGSLSSVEQETTTSSDGTQTTNSTTVNYDESGNTTGSQTTESTINPDGSSSSVSTHYDSNGNETGHENEVTDTEGNTSVQTVQKDNNGNDVVTGYDIDTTNNNNGGLEISNGLDTGVLVFDGHDWTATLKAEILFSDITPASTQFPLMNASSRGDDNKLDGAFLLVTRQTSGMGSGVYDENGTQQSTTTSSNPTLKWRIQHYLGGSLQNGIDFYYKNGTRAYYTNRFGSKSSAITLTYKMSYTESNHQLVTEIYDANGTNILAKPRSEAVITFTKTMSDITFELGQATNVSGVELKTKLEIIDFHVEKTL